MLDILAITGPIYMTIVLGYMTTRIGLFVKADMRVFGKFVINLALPALLFNALAQRRISEILNGSYVLAYLAGTLAVLGLGFLWCRRLANVNPTVGTFYVMGMTCSNSGFVGYPILLLTLAPVAGIALALNLIVENVVVIPLLLVLAERGRCNSMQLHRTIVLSLVRLASNPMIIGIVAGFTVSMLGWKLPEPVERTIKLFAMSSGVLSLFFIGGTLVGLPMRGMGQRVALVAVGKLVLHPLAVLLVILALPMMGLPTIDPALSMAAVLMAAMPIMSIYPILAQAYGQEDFSAAALLVTTATSFFTLSGLLWIFKHIMVWGVLAG